MCLWFFSTLSLFHLCSATPGGSLTSLNFNSSTEKNYIYYKMWDQIIYLFPNFNGPTVVVENGYVISART